MTRLHAVPPSEGQHSIRVPLTAECLADLEAVTRSVLAPLEVAHAELLHALTVRDRDLVVPALRRLVAVGGLAKSFADLIARESA